MDLAEYVRRSRLKAGLEENVKCDEVESPPDPEPAPPILLSSSEDDLAEIPLETPDEGVALMAIKTPTGGFQRLIITTDKTATSIHIIDDIDQGVKKVYVNALVLKDLRMRVTELFMKGLPVEVMDEMEALSTWATTREILLSAFSLIEPTPGYYCERDPNITKNDIIDLSLYNPNYLSVWSYITDAYDVSNSHCKN